MLPFTWCRAEGRVSGEVGGGEVLCYRRIAMTMGGLTSFLIITVMALLSSQVKIVVPVVMMLVLRVLFACAISNEGSRVSARSHVQSAMLLGHSMSSWLECERRKAIQKTDSLWYRPGKWCDLHSRCDSCGRGCRGALFIDRVRCIKLPRWLTHSGSPSSLRSSQDLCWHACLWLYVVRSLTASHYLCRMVLADLQYLSVLLLMGTLIAMWQAWC